MTSILITSSDKTKCQTLAMQLCQNYHIDKLDITILQTETSIGIDDIKKLQTKLLLKPFKSPAKAAIIYNAQTMTTEAQNAFLKTLEEPPDATYLFLTANSQEPFLPTILSRCKIISLGQKELVLSEEEQKEFTEVLSNLSNTSIASRLLLAQTAGKDKTTALAWLEKATIYLRNQLLSSYENQDQTATTINQLENFQKTYQIIKDTNVSPRFALENLFLSPFLLL